MSKFVLVDPQEELVQLVNKFRVVVEFTIEAECVDDAETEINEVIKEGILAIVGRDDQRAPVIVEYNVIENEPAELFE